MLGDTQEERRDVTDQTQSPPTPPGRAGRPSQHGGRILGRSSRAGAGCALWAGARPGSRRCRFGGVTPPWPALVERFGVERIMTPWPTVVRAVFATPRSLHPGRASTPGPYVDPTGPAGGRRRRTDREERHPRSAGCTPPQPTPIGSSTRCATTALRKRYRFPNSPRQVVVPATIVLGCPVHRVQAPEPPAPTSWSRSAERRVLHARPRRAVALRAPGAAQRERRRCPPLTYANPRYPESCSESLRFPWPTGRSRSWISAGG